MGWLGYALFSALFAGLVAIFGKVGMRDVDSAVATASRAIVMAVALLLLVVARQQAISFRQIPTRGWLFILLAGLAGAASWLCYFCALELGDAARVASVDRLSMLVTILFAVTFLGERLSTAAAVGALLILAGAILIARG
jgi:bacterial/archaeal transporter family protein